MIGLDTNVLVRFIMQDDERQAQLASSLIESLRAEAPGFVSAVSVVELIWVLDSCYGLTRKQLAAALEGLLRTQELVVENAETMWKALRLFRDAKGGFADCLIACSASSAGCERTMTFDRDAAKHCNMTLVV